jgi:hypothetical protein
MPLDELMMRLRTQRDRGEAMAAPASAPYTSSWLDVYEDVKQDAAPLRRARHVTAQ